MSAARSRCRWTIRRPRRPTPTVTVAEGRIDRIGKRPTACASHHQGRDRCAPATAPSPPPPRPCGRRTSRRSRATEDETPKPGRRREAGSGRAAVPCTPAANRRHRERGVPEPAASARRGSGAATALSGGRAARRAGTGAPAAAAQAGAAAPLPATPTTLPARTSARTRRRSTRMRCTRWRRRPSRRRCCNPAPCLRIRAAHAAAGDDADVERCAIRSRRRALLRAANSSRPPGR